MIKKFRRRAVLRKPENIILQIAQIKVCISIRLVEVNARRIPGGLHRLAEGSCALRQRQAIRRGDARGACDRLPVIEHGKLQRAAVKQLQRVIGLLAGLLERRGLREEIHADLHARSPCGRIVLGKPAVLTERALGIAAVADAQDGKVHARCTDGSPVDLLLMLRNVHAGQMCAFCIAQHAVFLIKRIGVIVILGNVLLLVRCGRSALKKAAVNENGGCRDHGDEQQRQQNIAQHDACTVFSVFLCHIPVLSGRRRRFSVVPTVYHIRQPAARAAVFRNSGLPPRTKYCRIGAYI